MIKKPKYSYESLKYFSSKIKQFNLLIVTATTIEKEILHNHLSPIKGKNSIIKISKGKQTYFLARFGSYNAVHVACGDMGAIGRESSLATTSDAITDCKPTIVLMVGIAFGVDNKKQKIGDVLISERVTPFEPQRVGKKIIYRGKECPSSVILLNKFRNADDWLHNIKGKNTKIIPGNILSGEKLIDNIKFRKRLTKHFSDVKGGEMEGAGIYTACEGKDIQWILVKGICDFADGMKRRNKKIKQEIAAESAVSLCEHVFNSDYTLTDIGLSLKNNRFNKKIITKKISNTELIEILKKQVERQIEKQINSGKYLRNIFIETGNQKDHLRYLSDSVFYSEKCFEEINILDFKYINKYYRKIKVPELNLDYKKFRLRYGNINIGNYYKYINRWIDNINNKTNKIYKILDSSDDRFGLELKLRDNIEDFTFLKSNIAIITETAGQGKTNLLCDFADNFLLKRNIPSVFLTGSEINAVDIENSVLNKLISQSANFSFEDFLNNLKSFCHQNNKYLIFIFDGINENKNSELLSKNLELFIEKLLKYDFVKIILSCRTEYYKHNFLNLEISSFSANIKKIDSLTPRFQDEDKIKAKLFKLYFEYFNISYSYIDDRVYKQLVNNFLLLRIFCEAYRNRDLRKIRNIYKVSLFEEYFNLKSSEIQKRLKQNDEFGIDGKLNIKYFFTNIAKYMIETKTYVNIPLDDMINNKESKEMYVRFLDENILLRRDLQTDGLKIFGNTEVVNFTFDEFRDFTISKYLVEQLYSQDQLLFTTFLESEIKNGYTLYEGCSTFLFYLSRKGRDDKLKDIISNQNWYHEVLSKCIFSLNDLQIINTDYDNLNTILKDDKYDNISLIWELILRYDTKKYTKININFLFEFVRSLDFELYQKCFVNSFGEGQYERHLINQESLIREISNILENSKSDLLSKYHKLFELLLYMFTNYNNTRIKLLYSKYLLKYKEKGIEQINDALKSKNGKLITEIKQFLNI